MDLILEILVILIIWILFVYYIGLKKYKIIRPYGPALMISTEKGKKSIERISKHRFWDYYGSAAIYITLISMVLTLALLIWEAILVVGLPKSAAPNALAVIGIPGINPYIPVTYGVIGLIVAVVIHELSHGIESERNKIGVKSLGVLWFIIPIGAFVEPDEEKIEKSEKKVRMKIFAAGPATNILTAIVALVIFLFLMSNVSVAQPGVLVVKSYNSDIKNGDLITSIGNQRIKNINELNTINIYPGKNVTVNIIRDSKNMAIKTISGVWIFNVLKNTPAYDAGISPGYVVLSINGNVVKNITFFNSYLDNTTANEKISITFLFNGQIFTKNVTLMDKYTFYESYAPSYNQPAFKGKGFLGVSVLYMNISVSQPESILNIVSNPFSNGPTQGILYLISLPFMGLSPFPSYFESIYTTPFISVIFWPVVNIIYWIFWLNLMLGLTNVLPLIPLDGGYVFKDYIIKFLAKMRIKNSEKVAFMITIVLSLIIVFLILWQFIYFVFV